MVRLAVLLTLLAVGCEEPDCVDMSRTEAGLEVVEAEHPTGWGEPACDGCHVRAALHDRSCTPYVDLALVRARVEAEPGNESCASCHGDNGVGE